MTGDFQENDPFPAAEFDSWAGEYDQDAAGETFPFTGYRDLLAEVVRQTGARPGLKVLDLGAGTGNLTQLLAAAGCEVWGTDFSSEMLARAREKLPGARLFLHDLRDPFPPELQQRFDCIVSAYVFHHFELPEKAALAERLVRESMAPGGCLVIGDISFLTAADRDTQRQTQGEYWDEEPYWIAEDALPALEARGLTVQYRQVSNCAGVYRIRLNEEADQ
ncbi:MAG TPA: methyltransferase domain-containing protein [Chloroflexi bacterium]|nr:methyltransferase domain-containing protein [Chloroflexota bacterium]